MFETTKKLTSWMLLCLISNVKIHFIIMSIYLTCSFGLEINQTAHLLENGTFEEANRTTFLPSLYSANISYWHFSDLMQNISYVKVKHGPDRLFTKEWCAFYRVLYEPIYGVSENNIAENSQNELPIHIPIVKWKSNTNFKNLLQKPLGNYISRRKIIKSYLPTLPLEPFQRVMTFAIEQNLFPDIWLVEQVYCMYVSISPFLNGIVMSYTLQDLLGASVISLDYKTEEFIIERCFKAVKMFNDDAISSKSVEVCNSMFRCLNEKPFSSGELNWLLTNLKTRIERTFKNLFLLKEQSGSYNHVLFAKYSLFLSISFFEKYRKEIDNYSLDRCYLVIRSMNTALILRILAIEYKCPVDVCSDYSIARASFNLVNKVKNLNHEFALQECIGICLSLNLFTQENSVTFATAFCIEMLSMGFIDERIRVPSGLDIETLSKSIMPSRLLKSGYSKKIPLLNENSELSSFSWVGEIPEVTSNENVKQKLIKKSIFTRKRITSKTSKASVKSSFGEPLTKNMKIKEKAKSRRSKLRSMFTHRRNRLDI